MLRIGRRTRVTGAILVVIAGLAAGGWAWEWAASRDAREARRALATGRYDTAQAAIARWMTARPDAAEAHFLQGRVALARGDRRGAAESWRRAQALGAAGPQLELLQAMIAAEQGRNEEAEPRLRHAWEAAHAPDPQRDELLARIYLQTFDLVRAAAVLDRWARAAPHDPKPHLWRAEVDSRVESAPDAVLNDYREALQRDPRLPRARLGLADELRKAHRNVNAAAEYDRYLALRPDDPAGHLGAGQNLLEMGEDDRALRHLERALALDPKNPMALKQSAEAALLRGDFPGALSYLDRAIALDPHDLPVRNRRRLTLAWLGRTVEAKAEESASRRLRTELDRLNEARARLAVSPHDQRAQTEIARWMIEHGQEREGVRWAEHVLRGQPADPEANQLLAEFHQRRGNAGLANFYRLNASAQPNSTPAPHGSTPDPRP